MFINGPAMIEKWINQVSIINAINNIDRFLGVKI